MGRGIGVGSVAGQLMLLASLAGCGGKTDSSNEPQGPNGGVQGHGTAGGAPSTTSAKGGATGVGEGGATGGKTGLGGSAGTAGSLVGAAGVADAGLAEFCVGDATKVDFQGQNLAPPTFNYDPMVALNCCNGFGVGLHTRDQLGYDLALEVVHTLNATGLAPGELIVGTGMLRSVTMSWMGAGATTAQSGMSGSMGLLGNAYGAVAWEVGFCLVANPLSEVFAGTRIYVPRATVMPYAWTKRLQIFQLADLTISPTQAQSIGLGSLVLAESPWLDLRTIAYVKQSTGTFIINLSYEYGSSLRSQLDSVTSRDRPFVVKADDVPIYLGTFFRGISAVMPVGPMIQIDKITDDRVIIAAPMNAASDSRFDARIIQVLSESGKLVP